MKLGWIFMSQLVVACNPQPDTRIAFPVRVHAVDELGDDVAHVAIRSGEEVLGETDVVGVLEHTFRRAVGTHLELSVTCPDGRALRERIPPIAVFPIGQARALNLTTVCAARDRHLVVVVRTLEEHGSQVGRPLPGLSVRVDGNEVGVTRQSGVLEVGLSGLAAESHVLQIGNDGLRLLPANPERVFQIPEHDDVVVFEQRFEPIEAAPAPRARRRRRAPTVPAGPRIPVRI